ncbi:hypothetical protein [Salinicola aestuarinus]|nr:hypothetical protein [Salinicola aestuarinus]
MGESPEISMLPAAPSQGHVADYRSCGGTAPWTKVEHDIAGLDAYYLA